MSPKNKSVIILVGMMGSGKSTVGKLLAKLLDYQFIDTDNLIIEKENESINDIFNKKGESYFRNLESEILDDLNLANCVIATGGGLPVYNQNMNNLIKIGTTIYLKITAAEIFFRIRQFDNRPLFENSIPKVQQMLNSRKSYYEMSKYSFDCSGKKPNEVVDEIKSKLNL